MECKLNIEGLGITTRRAINEGLVKAASVRRDRIEISHIQYADHTLFVVEGSKENATTLKWLLKNFELISVVSMNFDKNKLFGINIAVEVLVEMATELGCWVRMVPIS